MPTYNGKKVIPGVRSPCSGLIVQKALESCSLKPRLCCHIGLHQTFCWVFFHGFETENIWYFKGAFSKPSGKLIKVLKSEVSNSMIKNLVYVLNNQFSRWFEINPFRYYYRYLAMKFWNRHFQHINTFK